MLLRRRETLATVSAMLDDPAALMIAGVIALAGGLAMIIGYNVWHGSWLSIAVTCIGWVMAGKGATLLFLPSTRFKNFYRSLHYERFFTLYMGVTLVFGLALLCGSLG